VIESSTMNLEVDDFMGWDTDPTASQVYQNADHEQTQLAFIRPVDLLLSEVKPDHHRCVPPQRFLAFKKDDDFSRKFYRQVGSEFQDAAEATFALTEEGILEPVEVTLYGEQPSDRLNVSFLSVIGERKELAFGIIMNGRNILVIYNQRGLLLMMTHVADSFPYEGYYMHRRRQEIFLPDNDRAEYGYRRRFDPEADRVVLTRQVDGETETLGLPVYLDREEIIKSLFPRPILDDPIEADPSFDLDWKNITLENPFGIKWEIAKPA